MYIVDPTKLNFKGVFGMSNLQKTVESICDNWAVKILVGAAISINDWFFHPRHELVEVVFVLLMFDTITGLMKAFNCHSVSSSGFFRCALKLLVYLILLATGALLDKLVPLGTLISALSIIAVFLSITESLSILENIAGLGFEIPKKLVNLLKFAQGSDSIIDKKAEPGKGSALKKPA